MSDDNTTPEGTARLNDVHRADAEELLVLRHYKIIKGRHRAFAEASRHGVWHLYEKIGARVVGDWKLVNPDDAYPDSVSPSYDENFRLARYASFEHWRDTRRPFDMIGDGPLLDRGSEGGATRRHFVLGTDGAYFLRGTMAPDGPYYLPGLVVAADGSSVDGVESPAPVRYGAPLLGEPIVTLRYFRINKGAFPAFHAASREAVWPFYDKLGVRLIGQWRIVYPDLPAGAVIGTPSETYDEVLMMARYASYEHWNATRQPAQLGGNGPDFVACRDALALRASLTQETSVRFLAGALHDSPPTYTPVLT